MALSLQDGNKVWQKVNQALANANPAAVEAFKGLKAYLAQQAGNPQLQFLAFSEADADTADGKLLADAACKVYGFYVKKVNEGTDNTVKLFDDAVNDTTAGDQTLSLPLDVANEEAFVIYPRGFAHTAGVVVTQHTTIEGTTDGSSGGNGFVIIGAP